MSLDAGAVYSVPGKTFLVGEYVALDGGPSILLSTAPRFKLETAKSETEYSADGIHPDSPAGKLLRSIVSIGGPSAVKFVDPQAGKGGLGASTAQFALAYAHLDGIPGLGAESVKEILREYIQCAWNGEGTAPSGADLIAQMNGNVTYFDGKSFEVRTLRWDFEELGFTLFRTGSKLATHEHLKTPVKAPFRELRFIVQEALKSFETSDEMRLIEAVSAYSHVLRQADLTAGTTVDLLDRMRNQPNLFWAAKGCGAMGADILLALHDRKRSPEVAEWAKANALETCGTNADLSEGLRIDS